MTGTTRRQITFTRKDATGEVIEIVTRPTGTTVYVGNVTSRLCTLRVPGSLLEQRVPLTEVEPV